MADGLLTSRNTFQKFYEQAELAAWIEQTLGTVPVAAAPGVFYVFRRMDEQQSFLASRVTAYRPRLRLDPHLVFDRHREALDPVLEFMRLHARPPLATELPSSVVDEVAAAVGSVPRAGRVLREVIGEDQWRSATQTRQNELLVLLGLSPFGGRPRLNQLPPTLARDVKAHFGSYQQACSKADRLLYACGQPALMALVARKSPLGKITPGALYVHRSALDRLPVALRLYEGCARVLAGQVEGANVIKLSLGDPQVSYLAYPSFERDAHPALAAAVTVNLHRLSVDFRDYRQVANPPILHRKEQFVAGDHPKLDLWRRLTDREERAGLYEQPERIGTREGWQRTLVTRGVAIKGHQLRRLSSAPG